MSEYRTYCPNSGRTFDEPFVRELADDVRGEPTLSAGDRHTTLQLLYVVSAAILGRDTARRIFHVESIIQDPNVQELIREWEDKGAVKEAQRLLYKVLAARKLQVTTSARRRINRERDVTRLEAWLEIAVTARSLDEVFRVG